MSVRKAAAVDADAAASSVPRPIVGDACTTAGLGEINGLRLFRAEGDAVGEEHLFRLSTGGNNSLQRFHDLTVLLAAGAVKASREDRDDLQHVLRQFLLETRPLALVDDDDLDLLKLAYGEDQFGTKRSSRSLCVITSRRICRRLIISNSLYRPFLRSFIPEPRSVMISLRQPLAAQ